MEVQPLGDRVLCERIAQKEMTEGRIIIPETLRDETYVAKVVAVGPGEPQPVGRIVVGAGVSGRWPHDIEIQRRPVGCAPGDIVVFGKFSGAEVQVDGRELFIIRDDEVLAILKGFREEDVSDVKVTPKKKE